MVSGLVAAGTVVPVLSTSNCRFIVVAMSCLKRDDVEATTFDTLISEEI